MLKQAAGEYMGNSGSGGQAASGGTDWSALANLGSHMASHEEETGGNTNFSSFTNMYDTLQSAVECCTGRWLFS